MTCPNCGGSRKIGHRNCNWCNRIHCTLCGREISLAQHYAGWGRCRSCARLLKDKKCTPKITRRTGSPE